MEDLVSHRIRFQITDEKHGETIPFFERDNLKCSQLSILELAETEYYVGDSPMSDTISGHFDFQLVRSESVKRKCPYEIVFRTNLVRNKTSSDVYVYVDRLLETLNFAVQNSTPVQFDIQNELDDLGWYMTCS